MAIDRNYDVEAEQAANLPEAFPYSCPPTELNVSYGPHERHNFDLWVAQGTGPRPLFISIHGGGFGGGYKLVKGDILQACLKAGISVVALTYRLTPEVQARPPSTTVPGRCSSFAPTRTGGTSTRTGSQPSASRPGRGSPSGWHAKTTWPTRPRLIRWQGNQLGFSARPPSTLRPRMILGSSGPMSQAMPTGIPHWSNSSP